MDTLPVSRPARRPARKLDGQQAGRPQLVALQLRLPPATVERLKVHALAEARSASSLVDELVSTHLRRVNLSRRSSVSKPDDPSSFPSLASGA